MTDQAPIDWLRVLHRGSALLRALRGDAEIGSDTAREQGRAAQVRKTINDTARAVVGCRGRGTDCDCPVCSEEKAKP